MNRLHRIWQAGSLLILAICYGQTANAAPQLGVGFLFPTDGSSNVERNAGAKIMTLDFVREDRSPITAGDPRLPLNIAAATMSITITPMAGAPTTVDCTRGPVVAGGVPVLPSAGQCRFDIFDGTFPDGINSTLGVVYGSIFPATATVQVAVTNVRSNVAGGDAFNLSGTNWRFTTKAAAPRGPVSLEMVFDISGSMGLQATPAGCVPALTRMQALKDASQSIFDILGSYSLAGDKLGILYFSNIATPFGVASGTNLKDATNVTERNAIRSNLNIQSPTNSTSIGSGLTSAKEFLDSDTSPKKSIFLFSDGEQNTLPCVGEPNTSPCNSAVATSPPLRVNGSNYSAGIKVCPVTVGQFSGPAYVLQQNIGAVACDNHYVHAIINNPMSPTSCSQATNDLTTFFAQTLAKLLVGDKLENVRDVTGTIDAGTGASEKFFANTNDGSLSILLSWTPKGQAAERAVPFRLKAPDGTIIDPATVTKVGRGMSFTTIRVPLFLNGKVIRPKGEWEIQLIGTLLREPLDYHLIVMLDNANIASDFNVDIQDAGTGEPVPVRVKLTENDAPLAGANVVAQLIGPENGVGNILSTTRTPSGTPNTGGDTLRSEAQKKLLLLLEDPATASLFRDKSLPSMVLLDNGQAANGDTTPNDGIYSGLFTGTLQEGHYRFVVNLRGNSAVNGEFQRAQLLNIYVRPKPATANTNLALVSSTVQPDSSLIVRLRATPRDRFNNFIGPDYIGHMNIKSSQGTIETPLSDNLNGSYDISYRLPSTSSNPDITVEVLGTDVTTKPLHALGKGNPPGGGGKTLSPFSFSLHAGATFPHNSFGTAFNSGVSLGANLEYRLKPWFSLEAFLGHDRFNNKFINDDFFLTHLSGHAKFTFGSGTVRPSVHVGLGAYFPEGGGTHVGGNVGASLQFWLNPHFAIEPTYNFRVVDFSGSALKYSTLQGGFQYRF
jgi:hypothetical protein